MLLMTSFILCLTDSVFAQSSIQGLIINGGGEKLANANVLLLHAKDSSLVKGQVTTTNGRFNFDKVLPGDYIVAGSFTGLKQVYSSIQKVKGNESIEIAALQLVEKETVITGVTVTTRKPLFEQKPDRLVINVAASVTSAGSTALDVLERSPGIAVDRQNNLVAINGKNGVVVMINGKISHMPMEAVMQMLASMSSDNIDRIEIITTPPANFDAEGNAGYLNIVLKKNNQYGTNGSVALTAGYSKREVGEASGNFNHRKNNINLYGDYSFVRTHYNQEFDIYHAVTDMGKFIETDTRSNRDAIETSHSANMGLDVELDKKTIIGGLFSIYNRKWVMDAVTNGPSYVNHIPDSLVITNNHELHNLFDYTANLNLHHDYADGERLTLNADYVYYRDRNPNDYLNKYYDGGGHFLFDQQVKSSKLTPIHFIIFAADYTRKLGKKADLETGVKGTLSQFNNNVEIDRQTPSGWVKDVELSNEYALKENISAAYATVNTSLSAKWLMKFGLRYEYTNSNLGTPTEKNIVDRHYGKLFPSFFANYTLSEIQSINLSYSRRITRPTFNDMAPFVIFMDPNTYFSGNPALQPSISDAVNLAYTLKRNILSVSYTYEATPITNFSPRVDPKTNRETLAAENQRNRQTYAINLSVPIDVTAWWNMQNNLGGIMENLQGLYNNEPVVLKQQSFSFNTTQSFKLPKDYSLSISGFYNSASLFGIYKSPAYGSVDMGFQKKWPQSSLRINGGNLFNTLIFKPSINLPDKNLVTNAKLQFSYPGIRITYSHNFGNAKVRQARKRATGAEDEKSRVQ
jgi:outer membrane receptor protein involved in Fe transport